MKGAILSVMNQLITVQRNTGRDQDLKQDLVVLGSVLCRIEPVDSNRFNLQGIDATIVHQIHFIDTLGVKTGDVVIFPNQTEHEVLMIEKGFLFDLTDEYTTVYL